jgi:hypothetical protein
MGLFNGLRPFGVKKFPLLLFAESGLVQADSQTSATWEASTDSVFRKVILVA